MTFDANKVFLVGSRFCCIALNLQGNNFFYFKELIIKNFFNFEPFNTDVFTTCKPWFIHYEQNWNQKIFMGIYFTLDPSQNVEKWWESILILFHLVFCSPNLSIFSVGYLSLASKARQLILMLFPHRFTLLTSPMAEWRHFYSLLSLPLNSVSFFFFFFCLDLFSFFFFFNLNLFYPTTKVKEISSLKVTFSWMF